MILDRLKLFGGNSNPELTAKICDHLQIPQGKAVVKTFSDGEIMVEIGENVRGRDVFVIQSTCAPVNHNLMELLVIMDALKRAETGVGLANYPGITILWLRPPGYQGAAPGAH